MKTIWILLATVLLVGCNNEKNIGAPANNGNENRGNEAATPNKAYSTSNSIQQSSVPREGGNLDRGASRDNDPVNNAPGPNGTGLNQKAPGTGSATK